MSKGYVYVLSNPAMPGVVKIGHTTGDPSVRAAQLQSTGVPLPFVVEFFVLSPDCRELELSVHNCLPDRRVNGSREFFKCCAQEAIYLLEQQHQEQISCWLGEFSESFVLCNDDGFVDPASLHIMAKITARHFSEIPAILGEAMISDSDICFRELCRRYDDRRARHKPEVICEY